MKRIKITISLGTRPEAIKLCPLILELSAREEFDLRVVNTSQHRELCREVLDFFKIRADRDLDLMSDGQTLFDLTERVLSSMKSELLEFPPDLLLVHGDTTTAFASALAGFYLGVKVGHIEAGLRSGDQFSPFPEEFNRRAIDSISFCHFCPTELSVKNLQAEGIDTSRAFITGNTVVDALKYTVGSPKPRTDRAGCRMLMTLHRRESRGEAMRSILRGVRRAAEELDGIEILFPAHPAPEVRGAISEVFGTENAPQSIKIVDPMPLPEFHAALSECDFILSDSGGVQEEAVSLQKPLLLVRSNTERPEGVSSGFILPVNPDQNSVFDAICHLASTFRTDFPFDPDFKNPFGDGQASKRIADAVLSMF